MAAAAAGRLVTGCPEVQAAALMAKEPALRSTSPWRRRHAVAIRRTAAIQAVRLAMAVNADLHRSVLVAVEAGKVVVAVH